MPTASESDGFHDEIRFIAKYESPQLLEFHPD
jgi:hypothetical protein